MRKLVSSAFAFAMLAVVACGSSGGDGGAGTCGDTTCDADQFCQHVPCSYDTGAANTGEAHVTCAARPASCPATPGPKVCGDDSEIYDSECEAAKAGHGIGAGCAAPAGTFACGAYFCDAAAELCLGEWSDCGTGTQPFHCAPYPSTCATVPPTDCSCMSQSQLCTTHTPSCLQMDDAFQVVCL